MTLDEKMQWYATKNGDTSVDGFLKKLGDHDRQACGSNTSTAGMMMISQRNPGLNPVLVLALTLLRGKGFTFGSLLGRAARPRLTRTSSPDNFSRKEQQLLQSGCPMP